MTNAKGFREHLNINASNTFFTVLFFTGTILTYFEVDLYRLTLIPLMIPIAIWLSSGLIATLFFRKSLPNYLVQYLKKSYLIYQILYNTFALGGIVLYLFMSLNFYLAGKQQFKIALKSIDDGKYWEPRDPDPFPYRVVNYKGINKTLVFSQDTYAYELYTVNLVLHKGFFGFDIIESKTLSK
jgi:hypothetical protein